MQIRYQFFFLLFFTVFEERQFRTRVWTIHPPFRRTTTEITVWDYTDDEYEGSETESRIYNAEPLKEKDRRFLARIDVYKQALGMRWGKKYCTGSFIAPRLVLTSSRCFTDENTFFSSFDVVTGVGNPDDPADVKRAQQFIEVKVKHPFIDGSDGMIIVLDDDSARLPDGNDRSNFLNLPEPGDVENYVDKDKLVWIAGCAQSEGGDKRCKWASMKLRLGGLNLNVYGGPYNVERTLWSQNKHYTGRGE